MSSAVYICIALQIISAIITMVLVLMQKLKEGDGITVNNDNSNTSGMGMSRENKLSRLTVLFGIIFAVTTVAVSTLLVKSL